jgi:hypothetical protein
LRTPDQLTKEEADTLFAGIHKLVGEKTEFVLLYVDRKSTVVSYVSTLEPMVAANIMMKLAASVMEEYIDMEEDDPNGHVLQ